MSTDTKKSDAQVGGLALYLLLVVPLAAWCGYVVSRLWTWFVVPLGVPHVGVWHAAGICALVDLFIFSPTMAREKKSHSDLISYAIVAPAITLGMGALFHAFG